MTAGLTPSERAIRQHLAKDRPYNGGCGCMGAQLIDQTNRNRVVDWTVDVVLSEDRYTRVRQVSVLRAYSAISITDTTRALNDHKFQFKYDYQPDALINALKVYRIEHTVSNNAPKRYPFCPCEMQWVEDVDGVLFKIKEHRELDRIKLTATEVGPVGGPYLVN